MSKPNNNLAILAIPDDLELLRLSALIPKTPRTTTATIANTRCAQWIVCKATGVIDSPWAFRPKPRHRVKPSCQAVSGQRRSMQVGKSGQANTA